MNDIAHLQLHVVVDGTEMLGADQAPMHVAVFRSSILQTHCTSVASAPIDLWFCRTEDVVASALSVPQRTGLLTDAELERADKFRFPKNRSLYLTTRFMVRSVLSQYSYLSPAEWRFARNHFGRPSISVEIADEIRSHTGVAPVNFNLSRSGSLVVCAITRSGQIGVDVEDEHGLPNASEIAPAVLTPEELAYWRRVGKEEQSRTFLRYWVLKEALVKARGVGLTLDGESMSFAAVATSHPYLDGQTERRCVPWKFWLLRLFERYQLALAHSPI